VKGPVEEEEEKHLFCIVIEVQVIPYVSLPSIPVVETMLTFSPVVENLFHFQWMLSSAGEVMILTASIVWEGLLTLP